MAIDKALHTAHATSTGRRHAKTASPAGIIRLALATPKRRGGAGFARANPEHVHAILA
jgi:organic hydroperoxide reductase OsmC/OhrA